MHKTKPKAILIFKNCSYVCPYHCAQLSYITQHRAVLIIFPFILQTIIIAQITSTRGQRDMNIKDTADRPQCVCDFDINHMTDVLLCLCDVTINNMADWPWRVCDWNNQQAPSCPWPASVSLPRRLSSPCRPSCCTRLMFPSASSASQQSK